MSPYTLRLQARPTQPLYFPSPSKFYKVLTLSWILTPNSYQRRFSRYSCTVVTSQTTRAATARTEAAQMARRESENTTKRTRPALGRMLVASQALGNLRVSILHCRQRKNTYEASTSEERQTGLQCIMERIVTLNSTLSLNTLLVSLKVDQSPSPASTTNIIMPSRQNELTALHYALTFRKDPWMQQTVASPIPPRKQLYTNSPTFFRVSRHSSITYPSSPRIMPMPAMTQVANRQVLARLKEMKKSRQGRGVRSVSSESSYPKQRLRQGRSAAMKPAQQLMSSPQTGQTARTAVLQRSTWGTSCPLSLPWGSRTTPLTKQKQKRQMQRRSPKKLQQQLCWLSTLIVNSGSLMLQLRKRLPLCLAYGISARIVASSMANRKSASRSKLEVASCLSVPRGLLRCA